MANPRRSVAASYPGYYVRLIGGSGKRLRLRVPRALHAGDSPLRLGQIEWGRLAECRKWCDLEFYGLPGSKRHFAGNQQYLAEFLAFAAFEPDDVLSRPIDDFGFDSLEDPLA